MFTTENTHIFNKYLLTSHYESDTVSDTVLSPRGTNQEDASREGAAI